MPKRAPETGTGPSDAMTARASRTRWRLRAAGQRPRVCPRRWRPAARCSCCVAVGRRPRWQRRQAVRRRQQAVRWPRDGPGCRDRGMTASSPHGCPSRGARCSSSGWRRLVPASHCPWPHGWLHRCQEQVKHAPRRTSQERHSVSWSVGKDGCNEEEDGTGLLDACLQQVKQQQVKQHQ